jgi:hypothetical protein
MSLACACGLADRANDVDPTGEIVARSAALDQGQAVALCARGELTIQTIPSTNDPVSAHTTVVYDVAVGNDDAAGCDPRVLLFSSPHNATDFALFVSPTFTVASPGETVHFIVSWTSTAEATPGTHQTPFTVSDLATGSSVQGTLGYELAAHSSCFVWPSHELFITDLSVVEDPVRTTSPATTADPRAGAWTFGRLMEAVAKTPNDAPALVESLFDSWRSDQAINGFTVPSRPAIDPFLLERWPRRPDGQLDLAAAPVRLLAIVDRLDTRSLAHGHAGQGRFVFGVTDAGGFRSPFTIILEYRLPATSRRDVLRWARVWHSLGSLAFPSEAYRARLQEITDRFTARGADPSGVNGSALATLRTDEVALAAPWELRQFALANDGGLSETTVDDTPDLGFRGTPTLADFVNDFGRLFIYGRGFVPPTFEGAPFRGGAALNDLEAWDAPGIAFPATRRAFSLATCNGCHAAPETGTEFVHVAPRNAGEPSRLSGFLLGLAMPDPVTGALQTFNDIDRRKIDLEGLVCGSAPASVRRMEGMRWAHADPRDSDNR